MHLLSPAMCTSSRGSLTADLWGHLWYWVCHFPPFCASFWGALLLPERVWRLAGWLSVVLAVAGLIVLAGRFRRRLWLPVLALAVCAVLISAPQVFVLDDVWAYRTHYPMVVLVSMAVWIGFSSLLRPAWRGAAAKIVMGLLFLSAAWAVNVGIVYTSWREYSIVRSVVAEIRASGTKEACVLMMPEHYDLTLPVPIQSRSCYGYISVALMGDMEPNAVAEEEWCALQDLPKLHFVPADHPQDVPRGVPVYDLWGRIVGRPSPAAQPER
jgi:hypothetical protein